MVFAHPPYRFSPFLSEGLQTDVVRCRIFCFQGASQKLRIFLVASGQSELDEDGVHHFQIVTFQSQSNFYKQRCLNRRQSSLSWMIPIRYADSSIGPERGLNRVCTREGNQIISNGSFTNVKTIRQMFCCIKPYTAQIFPNCLSSLRWPQSPHPPHLALWF